MKIKTQCRHCGKLYLIASEHLGKVARCKKCHEYFEMSAYDGASPAPQSAPEASAAQAVAESPAPAHEPPPAAGTEPAPPPEPDPSPTQPATCPKCGYSEEIPRVTGYLKARCPQCGGWFKITPLSLARPMAAARWRGQGRPLRLALVLFLLLILLVGYFVAPALWPDLFPQSLS